jgi:dihydrofolate reductase
MRKLIVGEFLTLDGVMQAPGDANEDRSGGFDHGGWQLDYFDEVFANSMMEGFATTGSYLFGRRTYEIFANHWPKQGPDDPMAPIFNSAPKYVVSSTLRDPLPWQNSTLIPASGDIPATIRRLKEQDADGKDIRVIGSGELVQALLEHDLVDALDLAVHPLVLGTGKRLFREGSPLAKFRLLSAKPTSKGVLILRYELLAPGTATAIPVGEEAAATTR